MDSDEAVVSELTTVVKTHFPKARRGDVVKIKGLCGCRNMATYVVRDSGAVVPLETKHDEYGHVPPSLTVPGEFEPRYWSEAIAHNAIVWFDAAPYAEEIERSANFDRLAQLGSRKTRAKPDPALLKEAAAFGQFTCRGKTYPVGLSTDAIDEAEEQTPEVIRGFLNFVLRGGLLPWNYGEEDEDERTLLVGTEIVAIYGDKPGTGWRSCLSYSLIGSEETIIWSQRSASGQVILTTEVKPRTGASAKKAE